MKTKIVTSVASALALLLAVAAPSLASPYRVTVDTSSISGTYSLVFDLIDGDGVANNSVALSSFDFGGGSVSGSATLIGSATGDLSASVGLDDSAFFNEFMQGFTAGSVLSFVMDASTNFAGGSPDSFTVVLLDSGGNSVATSDPSGADALLALDIAPAATIQTYDGIDPLHVIPAPSVVAIPEPETLLLVVGGLLGLSFLRGRPTVLAGEDDLPATTG